MCIFFIYHREETKLFGSYYNPNNIGAIIYHRVSYIAEPCGPEAYMVEAEPCGAGYMWLKHIWLPLFCLSGLPSL